MPNYLINEIPDIANMRYLELGVFDSHHFSTIQSTDKTSVDIEHPADFIMSTDDFFAQTTRDEKWDVIYIDADHTWTSVLLDFNNSIKHLSLGGCIFLHDLYPETEHLTQSQFCGNAYIFLHHMLEASYPNVFTQDSDYGITFVYSPEYQLMPLGPNPTYRDFVKLHSEYKQYSKDEMIKIVRRQYLWVNMF